MHSKKMDSKNLTGCMYRIQFSSFINSTMRIKDVDSMQELKNTDCYNATCKNARKRKLIFEAPRRSRFMAK